MKSLREEIYEPEHEEGVTCWCKPVSRKEGDEYHIIHNEERDRIPALILSILDDVEEHASQQDDDTEIAGMFRAVAMIKNNLKL